MKREKTISLNRFSDIIINKLLFNLENEKIDFFFAFLASASVGAAMVAVVVSI